VILPGREIHSGHQCLIHALSSFFGLQFFSGGYDSIGLEGLVCVFGTSSYFFVAHWVVLVLCSFPFSVCVAEFPTSPPSLLLVCSPFSVSPISVTHLQTICRRFTAYPSLPNAVVFDPYILPAPASFLPSLLRVFCKVPFTF